MNLRNKFLLISLLPAGVVLAAVALLAAWSVGGRMEEEAKRRLATEVGILADVIDEANKDAVRVAQLMAGVQEDYLFGRREESLQMMRRVLETYQRFIGAYFVYEPNADGNDREWLRRVGPNDPSTDAAGRFLPYLFRDLSAGGKITLERAAALEGLWYDGVKRKFLSGAEERFLITEPYRYNEKNLIIEQSSPIVINGQFKGIAGVDRGLDYLDNFLLRLRPEKTADLTLVSTGGRIIASTHSQDFGFDLRTVRLTDLWLDENGQLATDLFKVVKGHWEVDEARLAREQGKRLRRDLIDIMEQLLQGAREHRVHEFQGVVTGAEAFGASALVPTGNWTLIMTVDAGHVTAPVRAAMKWVAIPAGLGLILVALVLIWAANRIAFRIGEVSGLARRVADGDLTAEVTIDCNDEVGFLQRSIRDMIGSLRALVERLKRAAIGLLSTANEVAAGSRQQEAVINEFSSSAAEITAAAKEISATSQELLRTMNELNEVAGKTASLADSGHAGLAGMAKTMAGLTGATTGISTRLAAISEKAGNISAVVTTISKVAEQTNLLSLNASIEAEKAGEYGRGFAVVAREIRRLADQTAAATVDIEDMVKEMQAAVSSGVMEMDKFTDAVRRGAGEIQQVGRQLEEIIRQVQTLTGRFANVAEGMRSQSEGAQQISAALVSLTEGVGQTAETVKSFHRVAEKLQQAVAELRDEIGRFRVAVTDDGKDGGARQP